MPETHPHNASPPALRDTAGGRFLPRAPGQFLNVQGDRCVARRSFMAAIACYSAARALGAHPADRLGQMWLCQMSLGRFADAHRESDLHRTLRQSGKVASGQTWGDPVWDGRPIDGRRALIRCHHGLGDAIQFLRYAPWIRSRARRLLIEGAPELGPLARPWIAPDAFHPYGETPRRDFDVEIEVMELAHYFRASPADSPKPPYIHAPEELTRAAASALGPQRGGPRIGLNWEAGAWNPHRAIPRELFMTLLRAAPGGFVSLARPRPRDDNDPSPALTLLPEWTEGLLPTAALISALDLVITTDTMTAHLAGALGKPVWILLPYDADWRWMTARADSPWYPSARLFRQRRRGRWEDVLASVGRELARFSRPQR